MLAEELEKSFRGWLPVLEAEPDPTKRFILLIAFIGEWLEERDLGRLIVTGGFAVEVYTGSTYRTMDVDVIAEGRAAEVLRRFLERISERIGRGYLPYHHSLQLKSIDIVSTIYRSKRKPFKLCLKGHCIYIEPPEEVIVRYLAGWKYWGSTEDRDKALLLYASWRERLDMEFLTGRAREEGVEDKLRELEELVEREGRGSLG